MLVHPQLEESTGAPCTNAKAFGFRKNQFWLRNSAFSPAFDSEPVVFVLMPSLTLMSNSSRHRSRCQERKGWRPIRHSTSWPRQARGCPGAHHRLQAGKPSDRPATPLAEHSGAGRLEDMRISARACRRPSRVANRKGLATICKLFSPTSITRCFPRRAAPGRSPRPAKSPPACGP